MVELLKEYKLEFDKELKFEIEPLYNVSQPVGEAMIYSLLSGGKRLRPILSYLAADFMNKGHNYVRSIALASEILHIYSLVHDDLESMDNGELRHGITATHVKYGEGMAVLCGDGLLNLAYETLLADLDSPDKIRAAVYIASMAGSQGMVGGQSIDLDNEGKEIPLELIIELYSKKTAALFKASLVGAAIACSATQEEISTLECYCENLGQVFQLVDDLLDVTSDATTLGKNIGMDMTSNKSTYLAHMGMEMTKMKVKSLTAENIKILEPFGKRANNLVELCKYLSNREY